MDNDQQHIPIAGKFQQAIALLSISRRSFTTCKYDGIIFSYLKLVYFCIFLDRNCINFHEYQDADFWINRYLLCSLFMLCDTISQRSTAALPLRIHRMGVTLSWVWEKFELIKNLINEWIIDWLMCLLYKQMTILVITAYTYFELGFSAVD